MHTPLTFWDEMAKRYPSYDDPAMREDVREVITWCESTGVDFREKRVLDIGCGTGTVAIPLAQRGAHVTGIDISALMLNKFRDDARRAEVDGQVTIRNMDWKKAAEPGNYDIAIASMTPAVSSDDEIDRMLQSAASCGIFVGWGAYRINKMLEALFEAHDCSCPTMAGTTRRFGDAMTRRGIEHKIHFFTTEWEERMNIDDARCYAYGQLERQSIEPDPCKVEAILHAHRTGNIVCFHTEAEKGVLLWHT